MKEQYKEIYNLLDSIKEKIERELKQDLSYDEYDNLVFYLDQLDDKLANDIIYGIIYE